MHLNVALNKQSVRKRTPGLFKEDRHIKHTRAGGYKPTLGVLLLLLRLSRTDWKTRNTLSSISKRATVLPS